MFTIELSLPYIVQVLLKLFFLSIFILFHSSSFRKIEGNKCVGGTEKDFFPVRTPCPVQGKGCTTCMYGVYNG